MIRKLLLSTVLAMTAATGLSLTAGNAAAEPPMHRQYDQHDRRDHRQNYEVLYQDRNHWDVYGTFRDRDDAQRTARQLRRQGYNVRIEQGHHRS